MKINYDVKKAQINAQDKLIKRYRFLIYFLLVLFVLSFGCFLGVLAL